MIDERINCSSVADSRVNTICWCWNGIKPKYVNGDVVSIYFDDKTIRLIPNEAKKVLVKEIVAVNVNRINYENMSQNNQTKVFALGEDGIFYKYCYPVNKKNIQEKNYK